MNQCDGCNRGLPVDDRGIHRGLGGPDMMACCKNKYKESEMSTLVATSRSYGDEPVAIAEQLITMKAEDLRSLLGYLKSEYDIDAPEGGTAVVETVTTVVEVVEQTSFDVHLKAIDPTKKIGIIKIVRAVTGLGLAESKALVEAAPTLVKEAMPKAEAEKLKKELEDTGAQVELK